jgi:hypothetical protein
LTRLIAVLDTPDLALAVERLEKGHGIARGEIKDPARTSWRFFLRQPSRTGDAVALISAEVTTIPTAGGLRHLRSTPL